MFDIPISSALGFSGALLLLGGLALLLIGLNIIKINSIIVNPGLATIAIGIILTSIGVLFLFIDANYFKPSPSGINSPTLDSRTATTESATIQINPVSTNSDEAEPDLMPSATTISSANLVSTQPANSDSSPADCSTMIVVEHHFPSLGEMWELDAISEDRVLTLWSNHHELNLGEYKFFLPTGQSASFMSGGGVEYRAKPGCSGVAEIVFERDFRDAITIDEYQAYIDTGVTP